MLKKQVPEVLQAKYRLTKKQNEIFNKSLQNKILPNQVYILNADSVSVRKQRLVNKN